MSKLDINSKQISRRSFLVGGSAALVAGGLAVSGCTNSTANVPVLTKEEILNAAVSYKASGMSPVATTNAVANAAHWHMFETLYRMDMRTYTTTNELATSEPVLVAPRTYEIPIREDVVYSDGTPLTAEDFVNAYQLNIQDTNFNTFLDFIESCSAPSTHKIRIVVKYDNYNKIEERLSLIKFFPRTLTSEQLATKPIGSGPYKLLSFETNDGGEIIFEPNNLYKGEYQAQTAGMKWISATDVSARAQLITNKTVDAVDAVTYNQEDLIKSSGATVTYQEGITGAHIIYNTMKKPFDDIRVRQAIQYAIDKEKILNNVFLGYGSVPSAFVPYNHESYHRATYVYDYNPDKARELLAQAGCSNLKLNINVQDSWVNYMTDSIKNDLEKVGIQVTYSVLNINWLNYAYKNGIVADYDIALVNGDPSVYGNDIEIIMRWWYADSTWARENSAWKFSDSEKWEELQLYAYNGITAPEDEKQMWWNKCIDLISEQIPCYPLVFCNNSTAINGAVILDYTPIATTGMNFVKCRMAKRN